MFEYNSVPELQLRSNPKAPAKELRERAGTFYLPYNGRIDEPSSPRPGESLEQRVVDPPIVAHKKVDKTTETLYS